MADKELFESALTEPETAPSEPARDERGRFAPKVEATEAPEAVEEPEVPVEQHEEPKPEPKDNQGIPPWRLREEAEARRAAEERANQAAQQLAEMQRRIAQIEQNKQPEKVPDIFEDPNAFVDHGVRSAIDPVKQEIARTKEFYSRLFAEKEFGAEKVKAAYDAIAQGMQMRDPEAVGVYQRAMQSMDPYGDIIRWHQQKTVYSQIGSDPNAWFEKQLEERLKDPAHQAKLIERIRGNVQPGQRPITQLPPSLNKVAAAVSSDDDGEDNTDAGLLKTALRR